MKLAVFLQTVTWAAVGQQMAMLCQCFLIFMFSHYLLAIAWVIVLLFFQTMCAFFFFFALSKTLTFQCVSVTNCTLFWYCWPLRGQTAEESKWKLKCLILCSAPSDFMRPPLFSVWSVSQQGNSLHSVMKQKSVLNKLCELLTKDKPIRSSSLLPNLPALRTLSSHFLITFFILWNDA